HRSEFIERHLRERSEDRQTVPPGRRHHLLRGPQRRCGRIPCVRADIVADKRCENGHFIDESWDLCPYCPADNSEAEIPIVRPTRFGPDGPRPVPVPAPALRDDSPGAAAAALPTEGRRPTNLPPPVVRRDAPAVQAP